MTRSERRTAVTITDSVSNAAVERNGAAARPKGPLVWRDMDQQELDAAYDQSKYAANQAQIQERRLLASARARAALGEPLRLAYGASPIEQLDVYCAKRSSQANAPVNVFIHGGAWRNGRSADFAYLAEMLVHAGAHSVILDFTSIDAAGGNLMTMAAQVRSAVAFVYNNAASFGGDPNRLYVSGHSSGGHLAGTVVAADWRRDFGLPADVVKGALLCSGMYDLEPVRLSARSSYVKFTDAIEQELSALRHLERIACPLVVGYGTCETPEFQRQARDFAAALKAAGKPVQLLVGEGYNHFEILETLANPYGLLGRAVLAQMRLAGE
jgi:arylformamidase